MEDGIDLKRFSNDELRCIATALDFYKDEFVLHEVDPERNEMFNIILDKINNRDIS